MREFTVIFKCGLTLVVAGFGAVDIRMFCNDCFRSYGVPVSVKPC